MAKIVENALVIYTDGSLKPKGRKGGYGIVFIHIDSVGEETILDEHSPPGISGTTNNRMELQACIDALAMAPDQNCFQSVNSVVIRTDSKYVVDNYKSALGNWLQNKWRDWNGKPIENADLWKDFSRKYRNVHKRVDIEWVKGHGKGRKKDQYNIRADALATESALSPLSRANYRSSVRRKFAPGETKRGSVRIEGQTMIIYIIETKWENVQKIWNYRYQVVSKEHPDLHAIDFIYSYEQLRDGHLYKVKVNHDIGNPQIVKMIEEVNREEFQN